MSKINFLNRIYEIYIQNSEGRKLLLEGPPESQIEKFVYDKRGYILFTRLTSRGDTPEIWALPFNMSSLSVSGKQFLVARDANRVNISDNGLLLYNRQSRTNEGEKLVLLSRSGEILKNIGQQQQAIYQPSLSPDGRSIATTSIGENGFIELWRHDMNNNVKTQLTFELEEPILPSWSPDGKRIAFQNGFSERADIYLLETNSISDPKPLLNSIDREMSPHWSADGRYILYAKEESNNNSNSNIWYMEWNKENSSKPLFKSRFEDSAPFMSPDGKYVVYESDKSGQFEIYVTNFPKADKHWQVSYNGGTDPEWIKDEIFFINKASNSLLISKVNQSADFQCKIPEVLFSPDPAQINLHSQTLQYTVTHDGQQIIAVKRLGDLANRALVLVENWLEEFKDRN